jgi:hypothetical protein
LKVDVLELPPELPPVAEGEVRPYLAGVAGAIRSHGAFLHAALLDPEMAKMVVEMLVHPREGLLFHI